MKEDTQDNKRLGQDFGTIKTKVTKQSIDAIKFG